MPDEISSNQRGAEAAGILMISTVISRILGYIRYIIIYSDLGLSGYTDAYNAAFSVPDLLYTLIVGGALSTAFIPVFTSYLAKDQEQEGWKTASSVINIMTLLIFFCIAILLWRTEALIQILAPGFAAEIQALTVTLTRVMFIQCFFMAMTGFSMGILHSYQRFLPVAISSIMYNVIIILIGVLLSPHIGVMGYTLGVVAGAIVQFAIQFRYLIKLGLRYEFLIDFKLPGVRKIFALLAPVLIGMSVSQLNLLVDQNLASGLPEGTLTALLIAQRMMQMPNGIFATAVAIAIFPTLTRQAALDDIKAFKDTASMSFRTILFVMIPASVGMAALREPIIRILYQQGRFSSLDTEAAAAALLFYCIGLCAFGGVQLFNRMFYAKQDTWTPVLIGIGSIGVNIILNLALIGPMAHSGLALASSIAGIIHLAALFYILRRRIGAMGGRRILTAFLKITLASLIMGFCAYGVSNLLGSMLDLTTKIGQFIQTGIAIMTGIAVFFVLARIINIEERLLVFDMLKRRLKRRNKVT